MPVSAAEFGSQLRVPKTNDRCAGHSANTVVVSADILLVRQLMAAAFAVAQGLHHCSQPTNLQSWFVHSHGCSAATMRCPYAIKVSAALSTTPVALSVGRRQLLAGFAAMTAGAIQVCRPVALAAAALITSS